MFVLQFLLSFKATLAKFIETINYRDNLLFYHTLEFRNLINLRKIVLQKLFCTTQHHYLPPWPCRPSGTSETGRTGSDFVDACPPGKLYRPNTRIWSLFARSFWRSPCNPRKCARHNVDRPRYRRIQRRADSGSRVRVLHWYRFRAMANWQWSSWCHRCRAALGTLCSHYC